MSLSMLMALALCAVLHTLITPGFNPSLCFGEWNIPGGACVHGLA